MAHPPLKKHHIIFFNGSECQKDDIYFLNNTQIEKLFKNLLFNEVYGQA